MTCIIARYTLILYMINDGLINNKNERLNLMIRLTIPQAIQYLLDKVCDMFDLKVIDKKQYDKKCMEIEALESNPMELKTRLEQASRNTMTLKGSREATNISFAPNKTQSKYGEASSLVGSIDNFIGKDGLEYTCGIYCKKVIVKKDTKK